MKALSNEYTGYTATFGKKDRTKTILIPWFTDFLSPLIPAVAELAGYRIVNCPKTSKTSAEIGLKYGNNEVCYPATLILGDLISEQAKKIIDLANQFGEGWLLAGEVACFARRGINRVVCVQPFGCIANHIVAKGIERRLKQFYPEMNLLYLDIDGGMAEVNIHNRLHFLIR